MPDPDAVKRVLAHLATRPSGAATRTFARLSRPATDYRTVIDRASAAIEELSAAATFVETVGTDRLVTAIEEAEAAGDHAAARRGQRALAAFQQFRTAASMTGSDHFHSGRGTTLGGDDEGAGK